ncbi:hypothetical protein AX16_003462 [Volvariella volvacea WC 439]|nr:hypothetical protein AX16_003462 [Volvariella volvacea WC 439]
MLELVADWSATLGLVFGGCCSNAITLEQLTAQYPHAGSLITLFQFILISLHGLPKHITWTRYGPRFKPRRIPIVPYLIQVGLYYFISLLNNAAFAYHIPMFVHIIFRSGGLIVSMVMGYLISGKRYNLTQVLSVLVVTSGVLLTTLSAYKPRPQPTTAFDSAAPDPYSYASGIAILSLALILSGFLGLVQDWTYSKYGRSKPTPSVSVPESYSKKSKSLTKDKDSHAQPWQESMFYLHFLALPMFYTVRSDLMTQLSTINTSGPTVSFHVTIPPVLTQPLYFLISLLTPLQPYLPSSDSTSVLSRFIMFTPLSDLTAPPARFLSLPSSFNPPPSSSGLLASVALPKPYISLLLNTLTQLLCVAGVHRLTSRVSSLTVTLVLVVRKAVSLILSVIAFGKSEGVRMEMMWFGAWLVFLGTVTYTMGSTSGHGHGRKSKRD